MSPFSYFSFFLSFSFWKEEREERERKRDTSKFKSALLFQIHMKPDANVKMTKKEITKKKKLKANEHTTLLKPEILDLD